MGYKAVWMEWKRDMICRSKGIEGTFAQILRTDGLNGKYNATGSGIESLSKRVNKLAERM